MQGKRLKAENLNRIFHNDVKGEKGKILFLSVLPRILGEIFLHINHNSNLGHEGGLLLEHLAGNTNQQDMSQILI